LRQVDVPGTQEVGPKDAIEVVIDGVGFGLLLSERGSHMLKGRDIALSLPVASLEVEKLCVSSPSCKNQMQDLWRAIVLDSDARPRIMRLSSRCSSSSSLESAMES
jgi:hypothetical protein